MELRLKRHAVIDRIELPAIITKTGVSISKSTVDYTGHYKGYPVAFDAKECAKERLNFNSHLKDHQIQYLSYWKKACSSQTKCFSGFVVHFYELDPEYLYFLDILRLDKMRDSNVKSIDIGHDAFQKYKFDALFLEEYFAN